MTPQRVLLALIALAVIAMLLPLGTVGVFDGQSRLTIVISDFDRVDFDSLYFAPCWQEADAQFAMEYGSAGEIPFRPADTIEHNRCTIPIPHSGRIDAFGRVSSYHQPRFLVIEHETVANDGARHRRRFAIPEGRGDREMLVALTNDAFN